MSANPLDIRMAHLEGAYEQVSHRLPGIEGRLDNIDAKIDRLAREMNDRFERMGHDVNTKIDRNTLAVAGLVLVSIILPIVRGH